MVSGFSTTTSAPASRPRTISPAWVKSGEVMITRSAPVSVMIAPGRPAAPVRIAVRIETGLGQLAQVHRQPPGVGLDQPDQLGVVAVGAGHGVEVHPDAVAGSDHDVASLGSH